MNCIATYEHDDNRTVQYTRTQKEKAVYDIASIASTADVMRTEDENDEYHRELPSAFANHANIHFTQCNGAAILREERFIITVFYALKL